MEGDLPTFCAWECGGFWGSAVLAHGTGTWYQNPLHLPLLSLTLASMRLICMAFNCEAQTSLCSLLPLRFGGVAEALCDIDVLRLSRRLLRWKSGVGAGRCELTGASAPTAATHVCNASGRVTFAFSNNSSKYQNYWFVGALHCFYVGLCNQNLPGRPGL